jgi:hypothetical protein
LVNRRLFLIERNSGYESKRVISESNSEIKLFDKILNAETSINKRLNSELKAQIPIVLYKNDKGTLGGTEETQSDYSLKVQGLQQRLCI